MAKINKVKEYASRYLKEVIGMSDEDISKEIGISVDAVKGIFVQSSENQKLKTVTSKANSFINQTAAKGVKNVTIMTENASRMCDDNKQSSNETRVRYKNCIHKARE